MFFLGFASPNDARMPCWLRLWDNLNPPLSAVAKVVQISFILLSVGLEQFLNMVLASRASGCLFGHPNH